MTMIKLPPRLDARPKAKDGKPIPYVQAFYPDGTPNFTLLDPHKVAIAAKDRLCGLCGEKLTYWIAFIGGPKSWEGRMFLDTGMHEDCAEAAMFLCPYIFLPKTNRSKKAEKEGVAPDGFVGEKPSHWLMGITRDYVAEMIKTRSGPMLVFAPAPWKRTRMFKWQGGKLQEVK
jgi:hypothetical protein